MNGEHTHSREDLGIQEMYSNMIIHMLIFLFYFLNSKHTATYFYFRIQLGFIYPLVFPSTVVL